MAVLKETTSPEKALQEVLHYKVPHSTKQMIDGLNKEPEITEDYIAALNKMGRKEIKVIKSGLQVSKSHGFLASSPNGLVYDGSHTPSEGLLEMKYIQMKECETIEECLLRKRICVENNGGLQVNSEHQYF